MVNAVSDRSEAERVCCKALKPPRATVGGNSQQFCRTVNVLMVCRTALGYDLMRLPPRHRFIAKAKMSQT